MHCFGTIDLHPKYALRIQVGNIQLETDLAFEVWKLDSVLTANSLTKYEQFCEYNYPQIHSRDDRGVCVVKLTFHSSITETTVNRLWGLQSI